MEVHNVQQRSPEWFKLRVRYPLTASNAQAIGNQGKGLETLCWEKKAEEYRVTERVEFDNEHLERGRELEAEAIEVYSSKYTPVKEVGFVTDESISKVGGASPDGETEDKNIEVKCFADTKYFKLLAEYKSTGKIKVEPQYEWQMQMQMLFTGKKKTDYILYNPNFADSLIVVEVAEDQEKQNKIKEGLKIGEKILKEIDQKLGTAF